MLTDVQCRKAPPREKAYKLSDAHGLYLQVSPTGAKSWKLKYRFPAGATERKLTFGPYPEVSLLEAREARERARKLLREGIDPAVHKKQRQAAALVSSGNTFEAIAREWHALKKPTWEPRYAQQIMRRLERHVLPELGRVAIKDITGAMVLRVIRAIEARGTHEMAHLVRQYISGVFVYAIGAGLAEDDPAHAIRSALKPVIAKRQPAFLNVVDARKVIAAVDTRRGVPIATKLASRLLALTAVRPGVLPKAVRSEFEDLDGKEPIWRIPAARMKQSAERKADVSWEFVVPLSRQAVETIQLAMQLAGRNSAIFPSSRATGKPMSNNTLGVLYRRIGFEDQHVPHGWRSTFSTIMNERSSKAERREDRAIIDLMLAHVPEGVEAAYNRSSYMARRRKIAQEWADLLMEGLPAPAELLKRD